MTSRVFINHQTIITRKIFRDYLPSLSTPTSKSASKGKENNILLIPLFYIKVKTLAKVSTKPDEKTFYVQYDRGIA